MNVKPIKSVLILLETILVIIVPKDGPKEKEIIAMTLTNAIIQHFSIVQMVCFVLILKVIYTLVQFIYQICYRQLYVSKMSNWFCTQ